MMTSKVRKLTISEMGCHFAIGYGFGLGSMETEVCKLELPARLGFNPVAEHKYSLCCNIMMAPTQVRTR